MFGNPWYNKIDFEYPTEAIFAQMPPDVKLVSVQFSTWHQNNCAISGIKCIYSNEQESPLFKKDGAQLYNTKEIKFDSLEKVASVQAYDNNEIWNCVYSVTFIDSNSNQIATY